MKVVSNGLANPSVLKGVSTSSPFQRWIWYRKIYPFQPD